MAVNAMSGWHLFMAHVSSPTPPRYLICMESLSLAWSFGLAGPIAALNFLSHVLSIGSAVRQLSVI